MSNVEGAASSPSDGGGAIGSMETLSQAVERLEQAGYVLTFRAQTGGLLEPPGGEPVAPESLVVDEVVRFEGASDPEDQAVLFALRSRDGALQGTFVASYGVQSDPLCALAMQRLEVG
jgi:hypothetical protein